LRQQLWAWELQLPPAVNSLLDNLTTDAQDLLIIALAIPLILGLETYFTLTNLVTSYPSLGPLLAPLIKATTIFYNFYLFGEAFIKDFGL